MAREELPNEHPLRALHGRPIGDYRLEVEAWGGRFVGQADFVLHLTTADGVRSGRPVAEGLYGRARFPGGRAEVERSILDVVLSRVADFGVQRVPLRASPLEQAIVGALCDTLQGTWSAMMYLAYGWKTLKQIQELRHPLQVTDEGHLLFLHDFRGGWKDYYYSEGWWEGPIKLKAERPPTAAYRALWDVENARGLLEFLRRAPVEGDMQCQEEGSHGTVTLPILDVERTARARALLMLQALELVDAGLLEQRGRVLALYPRPEEITALGRADLEGVAVKARGRR